MKKNAVYIQQYAFNNVLIIIPNSAQVDTSIILHMNGTAIC